MLKLAAIMIIPLLIAVYTVSFGTYTWRTGNKVGALGVYMLAGCSVLVPLLVMLLKS